MINNNVIVIDLRIFHPFIIDEIKKYESLSFRIINENDIYALLDPVINVLFFLKRNITNVGRRCRHSHLFLFYTLEDFIEIFDDLQIIFATFLANNGLQNNKNYSVVRLDNFSAFFTEVNQHGKPIHFQ